MKSLYNYIIYTDSRYNNKKNIDGKELILNSELSERDYKFVNRIGTVKSVPINYKTKIKPGDKVIVPVLAWSTTVFPLVQYGLIPVYVDISFGDFNLCKKVDFHYYFHLYIVIR